MWGNYDVAMTRARRAAAIALCVGLALGIAGLSVQPDVPRVIGGLAEPPATGSARPPGTASTSQSASSVPGVDEQTARLAAARSLLVARTAAVKARDKSSWMATVDAGGSVFGRRQSVVFDNLMKLRLATFSYGDVHLSRAVTASRLRQLGPTAWTATVTGTYSLAGPGRSAESFEATYTLARGASGWRLADDTDGVTALQVWDLPGLRVLRGRFAVVIGNAPQARMREYRTIADSAVHRVSGVWGTTWSSHVVVVTPSTDAEFAKLLSRPADKGLDQVAAITQGVIDPGQRAHGDRVVINPKAFTALRPLGRRVVVTHELTHIAARSSTTSPAPIWLTEGMADYVGYSGLDLPRQRVAGELLTRVRAGKGPTALPAELDFDPSRTTIAPAYTGSWLAVSRLVDLYGQAKVVAFYRVVASASTDGGAALVDPEATAVSAFPRSFGVTQAQFVDGWLRYLRALAHSGQ
jgi:hypothetical protein